MKSCKDQFKEFERKDVKYREDLKHLKQKIKKLEEKAEKVNTEMVSVVATNVLQARKAIVSPTS